MIEIAVSILSADWGNLRGEIAQIEDQIDALHFDIMDGHFVPDISFGVGLVEALRGHFTHPFYAHLMVNEPERFIEGLIRAGANAIYIHLESTPHLHRALDRIKEAGLSAGVALNPATPLHLLEDIWEITDNLLIMSVNPGAGGQVFLPFILNKIKKARQIIEERRLPTKIAVDGGINLETSVSAVEAGASILVVGSYVFNGENPRENLRKLREKIRII